jgi:predicted transposase/invertase (TIGR01784 family)
LRFVVSRALETPIEQVTVLTVQLPIEHDKDKNESFDVNCKATISGELCEMEMQANPMKGDSRKNSHANIRSRAIYNLTDLHSSQEAKGYHYDLLARSYQITFCRYQVFKDLKNFLNRFCFRNNQGRLLHNAVEIIFIELSKLKEVMKKDPKYMTSLEAFSVFLAVADQGKHKNLLKRIMEDKEEIMLASKILSRMSNDPVEQARYRARRIFERDQAHSLAVARDEGMAKGKAEGKAEGIAEVAQKLLKMGFPVEKIIEGTGLSRKEIESLR